MRDYIALTYGGIPEPSGKPLKDAKDLAEKCLNDLPKDNADKYKFPPKLLILLTSPDFINHGNNNHYAEHLLAGIHNIFNQAGASPSLIGSSVAGVFFDKEIHSKGALLICLASQLIDVEASYEKNAREQPERVVETLLSKLKLLNKPNPDSDNTGKNSSDKLLIDPNPLANKIILTFMPGCKPHPAPEKFYPAPELHHWLYEKVNARIMITGGVSSADDVTRKKDGYQFCEKKVLQDSIVAASITTGVPIGIGLNDALVPTRRILRTKEVNGNGRTIRQFYSMEDGDGTERSPCEELEQIGKVGSLMFAKLSSDDERMLDLPLKVDKKGAIELLRKTEVGDYFEVLEPQKDISLTLMKGIEQSRKRVVLIDNPIASILFPCKSYSRFHKGGLLNIESALAQIEEELPECPCIGGFFDGELGVDNKGRSRMTNGSVSYMTFGDEMRERTPLYKVVEAFTELGHQMLSGVKKATSDSFDKAIVTAREIVDMSGFPGAMISLIHPNLDRDEAKNIIQDKNSIIAHSATPNSRFATIFDEAKYPLDDPDNVLAIVFEEKVPKFIPDSKKEKKCNRKEIEKSGIISQYIVPLRRLNGSVFGMLQVDLGNLSSLTEADFEQTEKARVLKFLGETLGAGINNIANSVKNTIMLDIDRVLKQAMSKHGFLDGIREFVEGLQEIFGVEWGHLWLTKIDEQPDESTKPELFLEAGYGEYFNHLSKKGIRRKAPDTTPITLAFNKDGAHIINDTSADPKWLEFLKKGGNFDNDPKLKEIVSEIGSNAAIRFTGEKGKLLGAISFSTRRKWFFLEFHQNLMIVLADRLQFLVEQLKTKIHHKFLLDVSTKLTERNLDNTKSILTEVIKNFRQALNAEHASLYLWDRDREKYVLRAQSGWSDGRWVDAASHETYVGWMRLKGKGSIPTSETDLYKYYKEQGYEFPSGRYSKQIFGKRLSKTFTVEALGLPLQIGEQKEDRIGVLTFYREIKKGKPSGFTTKDTALLQEAANNIAGLIGAVIQHRDNILENEEHERREKVYDAVNPTEEENIFEENICCKVLEEYQASDVAFYRIDNLNTTKKCIWIAGYSRQGSSNKPERRAAAFDNYSDIVNETLNKCSGSISYKRYQFNEKELSNPEILKIEGLINELYLPLKSENEIIGALVIRWNFKLKAPFFPEDHLNLELLGILGRVVGSRYRRSQIIRESRLSTLALRVTAAFAGQSAHTLRHNVRSIEAEADRLKKGKGDIDELISHSRTARNNAKKIIGLGRRIVSQVRRKVSLSSLIASAFMKDKSILLEKFEDLKIKPPVIDDNKYFVYVDPHHTKEALYNLFDNAQQSINEKKRKGQMNGEPEINIKIISENSREIKLIISDNGEGMTKEESDKAKRGFWRRKDSDGKFHTSFGVLIADVLLTAQGGSLDYGIKKKGDGTDTIIVLPSVETE